MNKLNLANKIRVRKIGWFACLILLCMLVLGGLNPAQEAFKQSMGIERLLQASAGMPSDELKNPFVCERGPWNTIIARSAIASLNDKYLQGVGLCLAGDREDGLARMKEAGKHAYADVQYAASLSIRDAQLGKSGQAGADTLELTGINSDNLLKVVQKLLLQPGIDPFPLLRMLIKKAGSQSVAWGLWLQGSNTLLTDKKWQEAIDWIDEGLVVAPTNVHGSMYLRIGQIYQSNSDPRDYQSSLDYYQKALEAGGWIYPNDEVTLYVNRGGIYRNLKDEYGPLRAIEEYQTALKIQPNNYSALLSIGHVYLNDLVDLDKAEAYYRMGLTANDKSPYAYLYIGDVYRARGDKQSAAIWYQQALERQPDWQAAIDRLLELQGK